MTYKALGRYKEAEPMYERGLTIAVKMLGSNHPNTQKLIENFSVFYRDQGRDKEAKRLLRKYGQ